MYLQCDIAAELIESVRGEVEHYRAPKVPESYIYIYICFCAFKLLILDHRQVTQTLLRLALLPITELCAHLRLIFLTLTSQPTGNPRHWRSFQSIRPCNALIAYFQSACDMLSVLLLEVFLLCLVAPVDCLTPVYLTID